MICSRTFRSASECSCKFNAVPAAVNGFPFVGWVDEQIPSGCRLAKVGGEDYPFLVICDVSAQEVSDIPLNANWSRNVGNFCKDRFAKDLVLTLPLRDLQKTGSCAETAGFCDDYMSTPNATTTDTETPPAVPNRTVGAPVINPGASTN